MADMRDDHEHNVKVWTYFGDSTATLERQVQDLIDRGGRVLSLAIGYGPTPAKAAPLPHRDAGDAWHAMVVVDTSAIDLEA
jgi:hypothetical protein